MSSGWIPPLGGPGLFDGSEGRPRPIVPSLDDLPAANWYADRPNPEHYVEGARCELITRQAVASFLDDARAVEEPQSIGQALRRIYEQDDDLFEQIFGYASPEAFIEDAIEDSADLDLPWDPDLAMTAAPFPSLLVCGGYWDVPFPEVLRDLLAESEDYTFFDVYLPVEASDVAIERLRDSGAKVAEVPSLISDLAYFVHGGQLS